MRKLFSSLMNSSYYYFWLNEILLSFMLILFLF